MSNWQTVYIRCASEVAARTKLGNLLNIDLSGGQFPTGNEFYALTTFTQWTRWPGTNDKTDTGQATAGFWLMLRFDTDHVIGSKAYNLLSAWTEKQNLATPSNIWAGE